MDFIVREANENDASNIVSLFCENGSNPYEWTVDKWKHYYLDYPEGKAFSLVVDMDGKIIGHYGILQIKIGTGQAGLGMHAYVSKNYRGILVISLLMKKADEVCQKNHFGLICGFANPNFSTVKERVFKWVTLCWLGFKKNISIDDVAELQTRKFSFNYSQNWYTWRFGRLASAYISFYTDPEGITHKQLLKATDATQQSSLSDAEGWSPSYMFASQTMDRFSQPFLIKVYDERLLTSGIYDYNNWAIEMGDSDTFIYKPNHESE